MAMAKRAQIKSARAKYVRRSVTLPPKIARQVETLARQRALSDNRVLVELIEQGIEAQRQKEKAFFQLAERFRGGVTRSRSSSWEISWDALYLVNKCPGWPNEDRDLVSAPRRRS